jgi:hypothetical protein
LAKLDEIANKVRSKNAGPFWLTIDVFCGDEVSFERIARGLSTLHVAQLFQVETQLIKRFELPDLNVIKFSLPRPYTQGAASDRDMHGASWAALLAEIEIDDL